MPFVDISNLNVIERALFKVFRVMCGFSTETRRKSEQKAGRRNIQVRGDGMGRTPVAARVVCVGGVRLGDY